MFDLWGEAAPVPLPDLELAPEETPDRQKAFWEKELHGRELLGEALHAGDRR